MQIGKAYSWDLHFYIWGRWRFLRFGMHQPIFEQHFGSYFLLLFYNSLYFSMLVGNYCQEDRYIYNFELPFSNVHRLPYNC